MKIHISVIFYLERGLDLINGRPDLNNLNRTFLYIDILVGATITLKDSLLTSQIFRIEQSQGNRYWFLAIICLDRSSCDVSEPNGKCKEHFFFLFLRKTIGELALRKSIEKTHFGSLFFWCKSWPKGRKKRPHLIARCKFFLDLVTFKTELHFL